MPDPYAQKRPAKLEAPPHSASLYSRKAAILSDVTLIDWTGFDTAYRAPETVPLDLRLLLLGSHQQALDAAHRLWCGLCHQHVYMSSAAEPAYPFLMLGLRESAPLVQIEILDILVGFAVCSHPDLPFSMRVLDRLREDRATFGLLREGPHSELVEFADSLCTILDSV